MRPFAFPLILALSLLAGCQNPSSSAVLPDACSQPPESGMCKAAFTRYYYDADSNSCQSFIWGGCKGSVPFETREDCVSSCNAVDSEANAPYSAKGAPQ
ncbi:BPTI/Kunitz domain-containing protein [Alcanivorax sp. S6407]|uniref:BPTI/Kunitz domain-containing protein n=1 Tax=Alcanivorax sp. S6407 TaxID=2926424 RepID=UPI001FF0E849|nr:BPTI/Kunitz domain-containing protein [Alcanivorax sp. S6407]MCK0153726.1 BPTI/Kunitz domain-containing protein [Alcanivorax sp. S6407]